MTFDKLQQLVKEELTKSLDARDSLAKAELRVERTLRDASGNEARIATFMVRRYYPQIAGAAGIAG